MGHGEIPPTIRYKPPLAEYNGLFQFTFLSGDLLPRRTSCLIGLARDALALGTYARYRFPPGQTLVERLRYDKIGFRGRRHL